MGKKLEKLSEVVAKHSGEVFNILIAQIDPDALGSAFAMRFLLEKRFGEKTAIFYAGGWGHPQNRAIANKFDLKNQMKLVSGLEADQNIILVDSSLGKDGRFLGREFSPIIVVDHHRSSDLEETEDSFIWIENVGSASTLMTELLREAFPDIEDDAESSEEEGEPEEKTPSLHAIFKGDATLPILLALGIYTDCDNLLDTCSRDRAAHNYLSDYFTAGDIRPLANYPLPESFFNNLGSALRWDEKGGRLVASVGNLSEESGDDLSTIADLFLRKPGVDLAVVCGIVESYDDEGNTNTSVRISARNRDLSVPLDEFLRARFGNRSGAKLTPDGKGEGGALISLDLGDWMDDTNVEEVSAMVGKRIASKIFGNGNLTRKIARVARSNSENA